MANGPTNAASVYVEMQVVSALLEAFNMDPDDMVKGTARQFISALDDRGIDLVPR